MNVRWRYRSALKGHAKTFKIASETIINEDTEIISGKVYYEDIVRLRAKVILTYGMIAAVLFEDGPMLYVTLKLSFFSGKILNHSWMAEFSLTLSCMSLVYKFFNISRLRYNKRLLQKLEADFDAQLLKTNGKRRASFEERQDNKRHHFYFVHVLTVEQGSMGDNAFVGNEELVKFYKHGKNFTRKYLVKESLYGQQSYVEEYSIEFPKIHKAVISALFEILMCTSKKKRKRKKRKERHKVLAVLKRKGHSNFQDMANIGRLIRNFRAADQTKKFSIKDLCFELNKWGSYDSKKKKEKGKKKTRALKTDEKVREADFEYALLCDYARRRFARFERLRVVRLSQKKTQSFKDLSKSFIHRVKKFRKPGEGSKPISLDSGILADDKLRRSLKAALFYLESLEREELINVWGWDSKWGVMSRSSNFEGSELVADTLTNLDL